MPSFIYPSEEDFSGIRASGGLTEFAISGPTFAVDVDEWEGKFPLLSVRSAPSIVDQEKNENNNFQEWRNMAFDKVTFVVYSSIFVLNYGIEEVKAFEQNHKIGARVRDFASSTYKQVRDYEEKHLILMGLKTRMKDGFERMFACGGRSANKQVM